MRGPSDRLDRVYSDEKLLKVTRDHHDSSCLSTSSAMVYLRGVSSLVSLSALATSSAFVAPGQTACMHASRKRLRFAVQLRRQTTAVIESCAFRVPMLLLYAVELPPLCY